MTPLMTEFYALQDAFMDKGFYSAELFTEFRAIQSIASQNEFDVHRLTLEVEHLRAENMRLKVAKAMSEDKEYAWFIKDKLGQEELQANFKPEMRETA